MSKNKASANVQTPSKRAAPRIDELFASGSAGKKLKGAKEAKGKAGSAKLSCVVVPTSTPLKPETSEDYDETGFVPEAIHNTVQYTRAGKTYSDLKVEKNRFVNEVVKFISQRAVVPKTFENDKQFGPLSGIRSVEARAWLWSDEGGGSESDHQYSDRFMS